MQKNFLKKISCILFVVGLSACSTKESSIHAILSWKQEPLQSAQEVVQQLSDQKIQRLYQYPNTWEISAWDELGKQCQKQNRIICHDWRTRMGVGKKWNITYEDD